jgi:hypothetical protein
MKDNKKRKNEIDTMWKLQNVQGQMGIVATRLKPAQACPYAYLLELFCCH